MIFPTKAAGAQGSRARDRYVRLFPKRFAQLRLALTPPQFVAYLALLSALMQHGELPDDDKVLARHAGIGAKAWAELREVVIGHGFARVEQGKFIDDDQHENLVRQEAASERQRAKALLRQQKLREVRRA